MIEPVRLQLSRKGGFSLQVHSHEVNGLPVVNVARPSNFGNPFPHDISGKADAVDRFRRLLAGNMSTLEMSQSSRCDKWSSPPTISLVTVRKWILDGLPKLRGYNLACWCKLCAAHQANGKPRNVVCTACAPCHADVLLALANEHNQRS